MGLPVDNTTSPFRSVSPRDNFPILAPRAICRSYWADGRVKFSPLTSLPLHFEKRSIPSPQAGATRSIARPRLEPSCPSSFASQIVGLASISYQVAYRTAGRVLPPLMMFGRKSSHRYNFTLLSAFTTRLARLSHPLAPTASRTAEHLPAVPGYWRTRVARTLHHSGSRSSLS